MTSAGWADAEATQSAAISEPPSTAVAAPLRDVSGPAIAPMPVIVATPRPARVALATRARDQSSVREGVAAGHRGDPDDEGAAPLPVGDEGPGDLGVEQRDSEETGSQDEHAGRKSSGRSAAQRPSPAGRRRRRRAAAPAPGVRQLPTDASGPTRSTIQPRSAPDHASPAAAPSVTYRRSLMALQWSPPATATSRGALHVSRPSLTGSEPPRNVASGTGPVQAQRSTVRTERKSHGPEASSVCRHAGVRAPAGGAAVLPDQPATGRGVHRPRRHLGRGRPGRTQADHDPHRGARGLQEAEGEHQPGPDPEPDHRAQPGLPGHQSRHLQGARTRGRASSPTRRSSSSSPRRTPTARGPTGSCACRPTARRSAPATG